ncbi:uncharacterized protein Hap1MRO34_007631 [Clarias gariepinus]
MQFIDGLILENAFTFSANARFVLILSAVVSGHILFSFNYTAGFPPVYKLTGKLGINCPTSGYILEWTVFEYQTPGGILLKGSFSLPGFGFFIEASMETQDPRVALIPVMMSVCAAVYRWWI